MSKIKTSDKPQAKPKQASSKEDDPEAIYRIYSLLAYFFVLVVLGMPIWWYTTRVYRASLPVDEMYEVKLRNIKERQLGVPLSLEYDILITLVNPDPAVLTIDITGEELEHNLQPFLEPISSIANFVVKSQWLYLIELGAIPRRINDKFVLFENQLPHVITPLEKKLWSHLSSRPSLNLVVYFPHCEAPLHIFNSNNELVESNAFLSPRWGGITIVNPTKEACKSHKFKPDMKTIISTFVTQIQHLFNMKNSSEVAVDELKANKALEMLESTRRTLKSLAQLLSEISSIVISDEVAEKINVAVENADKAEKFLEENDIENALKFAKIGFENSEAAFSDPSLLALLYFPEDQKYAVYIPLFLPVMIPVLMSLTTVRKYYLNKKKVKTD